MENKKTKEEHMADWAISGISKAEYCRQKGIRYQTFMNWQQRTNEINLEWNPIQIQEDQEESKSFFELRFGGKWKIEINLRIRL
jgi:hypothetical protein